MDAKEAFDLAGSAYENGDLPTALEWAQKALDLASEWPLRGHVLHGLGVINGELNDRNEALRYWTTFFDEVATCAEFPSLKIAIGRFNFGVTLRMLDRYGEAIDQYAQALPTMKEANFERIVWAYHNVAWTACLLNDAELAWEMLELARHTRPSDDSDIFHQVVGEAFAHFVSGNFGETMKYVTELVSDKCVAPNDVKAQACWLAGCVALSAQNAEEASMWRQRAEEFANSDNSARRLMVDVNALQARIESVH